MSWVLESVKLFSSFSSIGTILGDLSSLAQGDAIASAALLPSLLESRNGDFGGLLSLTMVGGIFVFMFVASVISFLDSTGVPPIPILVFFVWSVSGDTVLRLEDSSSWMIVWLITCGSTLFTPLGKRQENLVDLPSPLLPPVKFFSSGKEAERCMSSSLRDDANIKL